MQKICLILFTLISMVFLLINLLKALQDAEGDISYGNLYDAINIEVNKTTLRNQGMEQTPKVNTSSKVINDWINWKL